MARKKIAEGYGGTSEQRQRQLQGDSFSERAPHTPAESEATRSTPDKDGTMVTVHPLENEDEDDLWRGKP
ncbi:hypothetical protein HUA74_17845 [Myxococcus sp. CA051A]|uniref:Uncharacterized protein n=1 Tax=Myxococcus llanfairpwllgwyngyllgogerychwyrndrobwllllantysiliogogogochensis TaxID=2590453 RepID=A0A540X495_9BACT|nr:MULTISPECIES: hypothetical protein [Myxococcus]NTX06787.1 hypothetical protein [Myxococcus sp. CA040A]NTX13902.1 hypothetical protein [Myxococcus sp. CA056]NTX36842.1 hypothetical protein [Myxococcus sp. CA033]NTX51046.1 hypothetical protein [Myxococcus sp. CA039A]NTX62519.1 hypothetical protein [Myxococcus sp. CA051A]